MYRTKQFLIVPVCLLLTLVACAEPASEPAPKIERGLVIDEAEGVVNGSFVDNEHALAFSGEVADGGFNLNIELNGMTITVQQDRDGIISYDGYASNSNAATQMTSDDRAALASLAEALDARGATAGPATARVRSFASMWSEFPSSMALRGVTNASFRSATSLCGQLNTFVETTHDDATRKEWQDETTFYAYLSMTEPGPCLEVADGTWFWTESDWKCYEPDHDPNVEYAYGNCFGRCGNRCGSDTQFTTDCANLDNCQRFGHTINDPACEDEFLAAIDDMFSAPNCL